MSRFGNFCMAGGAVAGFLTAALVFAPSHAAAAAPLRQTLSFDSGWRFAKGDAAGAQTPTFDDSGWRIVDVPHDWSIEGPFAADNPTSGAGAFLPAGIGWYRKTFTLPASDAGKRVSVRFDGVMANSDVWINGVHLGHRPSGYVSLAYDLTDHLRFGGAGAANVLAVRVDDSQQPASRWYAGAGLYRPVWLEVTPRTHLAAGETFVSTPQVSADKATVRVEATVVNESKQPARNVSLAVTLLKPDGTPAEATVRTPAYATLASPASGGESRVTTVCQIPIRKPLLWDLDHPALYRAVVREYVGKTPVDEAETTFGIRELRFDAATGFYLNGKNLKIKGVAIHQDGGAFGVAVPDAVWRQRLTTLKSLGVNAIRCAHCPFSPQFLDMCDRMGLLVMDEMFDAWTVGKEPYDYHLYFKDWSLRDLRDTVRRDRNHPAIILYSAGNEIRDTPNAASAKATLTGLVAEFHKNDPSRPVTQALFRPNASGDYHDGLADLLDVVGQNYRENELLAAHADKPTRKIIGTETTHDRKSWLACRDNPAFAGQFLWTGIDYLGESRRWPVVGAGAGLLDRTGLPRPLAYQRQSWWSDAPMVYMARRTARSIASPTDPGYETAAQDMLRRPQTLFADWTPTDAAPHEETVEVYSNCPAVRLELNGTPVGDSQPLPTDATPRVWKVPYAPGTLTAVGLDAAGRTVAIFSRKTAGAPARILLEPQGKGRFPLVGVRATVVDANGVPIPNAADLVTFSVTGPARVAAVDNGDNASHEPFQAMQRHAYQGTCVAYIAAAATGTGPVTVTASAPGLASGTLTLTNLASLSPSASEAGRSR